MPGKILHFWNPTARERKAHIELLIERFGIDEIKVFVKGDEGEAI